MNKQNKVSSETNFSSELIKLIEVKNAENSLSDRELTEETEQSKRRKHLMEQLTETTSTLGSQELASGIIRSNIELIRREEKLLHSVIESLSKLLVAHKLQHFHDEAVVLNNSSDNLK